MSADHDVLKPANIKGVEFKNRVVMAPMTRSRASSEGVQPPYVADYYAQRSGCALIVTEATNISQEGVGYAGTPGIWSDAQVESWKPVTDAVHANGSLIFLQLWHTGRVSHQSFQPNGGLPVSASAIAIDEVARTYEGPKPHPVPRPLETDEVARVVDDYRHAAANAKRAGFDGVEVHSANNYLLEQFVRDTTNKRTDKYGGSIENRLRFPLAVVDAAVDVWGAKGVGIRLSPTTTWPGNTGVDSTVAQTYGTYVDELSKRGLLYAHFIEGVTQGTRVTEDALDFRELRRRFSGIYISNNCLTLELAEAKFGAGDADLFAFGRPFIANPDLIERWRKNAPLAESSPDVYYQGGPRGYLDFPVFDVAS